MTALRLRQRIKASILKANRASERGVLVAARCLDVVVKTARDHINKTTELLRAQTGDQSLTSAVKLLSRTTLAYFETTTTSMEAQRDRCFEMTKHLEQISASARLIDGLTLESRILAVNAQIEASRLAETAGGGGLSVIALEMSRLSQSISQANRMIGEFARLLGEAVPVLDHKSAEMLAQSNAFNAQLDAHLGQIDSRASQLQKVIADSLVAGEQVTTTIVRQTLDALSALQFQDATAQELARTDAWFDEDEEGASQPDAAPSVAAGALTMFT